MLRFRHRVSGLALRLSPLWASANSRFSWQQRCNSSVGQSAGRKTLASVVEDFVKRDDFVPITSVSNHVLSLGDDAVEEELEAIQGLKNFFREHSDKYEMRSKSNGAIIVRAVVPSREENVQEQEGTGDQRSVPRKGSDLREELESLIPTTTYAPVQEIFLSLSSAAKFRLHNDSNELLRYLRSKHNDFSLTPDEQLVARLSQGVRPPDALQAMSKYSENRFENDALTGSQSNHILHAPDPAFPFQRSKSVRVTSLKDIWNGIDPAIVLPFVPPFFVLWSIVFEALPTHIRDKMPKHRRMEFVVSLLMEYCDFSLTVMEHLGVKIRLKADCTHPAINPTAASQLYAALHVDEEAVMEMAQRLPLVEIQLQALDTHIEDHLRKRVFRRKGKRAQQLQRFPFMFIVTNGGSHVGCLVNASMQIQHFHGESSGNSIMPVEENLIGEMESVLNKSPTGSIPTMDVAATLTMDSRSKLQELGGLARMIVRHSNRLTIDDAGDLSCHVNQACVNRLGTLLTKETLYDVPATEEQLDDFRFSNRRIARKMERKVELRRSRFKSKEYRDPDVLLQKIASYVPKEGYIDYSYLCECVGDEAKAWIRGSLLKYIRYHSRVFDIKERMEGTQVFYEVRKRQAGEEVTRESEYDDDEAAINIVSLFINPNHGSSLYHIAGRLPLSARLSIRSRYGSLNRFCRAHPDFFTVVTAVNAGNRNWVFFAGSDIPADVGDGEDLTEKTEGGDEEENGAEEGEEEEQES